MFEYRPGWRRLRLRLHRARACRHTSGGADATAVANAPIPSIQGPPWCRLRASAGEFGSAVAITPTPADRPDLVRDGSCPGRARPDRAASRHLSGRHQEHRRRWWVDRVGRQRQDAACLAAKRIDAGTRRLWRGGESRSSPIAPDLGYIDPDYFSVVMKLTRSSDTSLSEGCFAISRAWKRRPGRARPLFRRR